MPAATRTIEPLAQALAALGLNHRSIARLAEPGDDLRSPLGPTREALYSDAPVAVAMRLLFCRVSVPDDEAASALGETLVERLVELGLLSKSGSDLAAPYHLRMVRNLFLFSDYLGTGANSDAVMGAGETTAVLYEAARPGRRLGSALDLGCGAGTLALLMAADCERVVGTDINPRATRLAQLNAEVNGIANAEFLTGSLWEPVAGRRFDWIVSQPPYYPRAATVGDLTYLHGGVRGDELPLGVVNGVREHLNPSGRALVFTSWPQDRRERIAPGMRVLELTANRRELSGSRQSIDVIEHPGEAGPWFLRTEVSAECWGNVRPKHIDALIENGNLSFADETLHGARLRLAEGLRLDAEGERPMLRGEAGALLAVQPITTDDASRLAGIVKAERCEDSGVTPASIRDYLARGWLTVRHG